MQTLRDRLEALRERLLDLSFRNRLLNHTDTGRRILKVRRLSLAELYTVLVDEGPIWYAGPDAVRRAVAYAQYRSLSRSHRAIIRVFYEAGNVLETHEHKGDFKER